MSVREQLGWLDMADSNRQWVMPCRGGLQARVMHMQQCGRDMHMLRRDARCLRALPACHGKHARGYAAGVSRSMVPFCILVLLMVAHLGC